MKKLKKQKVKETLILAISFFENEKLNSIIN